MNTTKEKLTKKLEQLETILKNSELTSSMDDNELRREAMQYTIKMAIFIFLF